MSLQTRLSIGLPMVTGGGYKYYTKVHPKGSMYNHQGDSHNHGLNNL